jgi:hypothetical protein
VMSRLLNDLDLSQFLDIAGVSVGRERARRWGCGSPEMNRWIDSPVNR